MYLVMGTKEPPILANWLGRAKEQVYFVICYLAAHLDPKTLKTNRDRDKEVEVLFKFVKLDRLALLIPYPC